MLLVALHYVDYSLLTLRELFDTRSLTIFQSDDLLMKL